MSVNMNLIDQIDFELQRCGLKPISDVVNNKDKCFKYVNELLKKVGNNVTIPDRIEVDKYDFRIKHVLLSFGLGFIFADFNDIKTKINSQYHIPDVADTFIYTWLTLCLYHDYGYFIKSDYTDVNSFADISLDHSIFDYDYCQSRYTYNFYAEYYNNKYQNQLKNENRQDWKGEEVGDHGILGGYVLFDKLYRNSADMEAKNKGLIQQKNSFYQDICYRIMEHNIWRQKEKYGKDHAYYEISNENFRLIDIYEPLLYILSIVDTIEMSKKFCKNPENQSSRAVLPKIISSQFNVKVTESSIIIDYSNLEDYIKRNNYKNANIDAWVSGVLELQEWVVLTSKNNDLLKQIVIGISA